VDNAWEQGKLEARKILENAAESHTSGARFVGTLLAIAQPRTATPYTSLMDRRTKRIMYEINV